MTAMAHLNVRPGVAADDRLPREAVVQLGTWMFLGTVTMLFAAFVSAFLVRRSGPDWQAWALPPILWANTAVLAAVSGAIELAARRRSPGALRGALASALVLGVLFLVGQAAAWRQLVEAGMTLATSSFGAFVYMITGAHALHVMAAWILLAWTNVATWRGMDASPDRRLDTLLDATRAFWHFLGVLWLALFLFVSVS
jgi:cytochrome c oxidase subunit 3